jgi:hypothetical protein
MHFAYTEKVEAIRRRLIEFMDAHVHPNEPRFEAWLAEAPSLSEPRRCSAS